MQLVHLFIKTPYCLLKTVSLNVTSGFILVRTKAADKGLFVCLWICILNILNILSKLLINPERFIMPCLWVGVVESGVVQSSFRQFCVSFWGCPLMTRFPLSCQLFENIFFALILRSSLTATGGWMFVFLSLLCTCVKKNYRTGSSLQDTWYGCNWWPTFGGVPVTLMNINHYAIKTLRFRCQFPICVMGFKLTSVSVEKAASTREKRLRN